MIYKNKQSGFSLIETLVAISLLLIIIAGPMTISTKTAKSSTFATEQVQAFFLAQEGLELAQKKRDDYRLLYYKDRLANPNPWSSFKLWADGAGCTTSINPNGCGLAWSSSDNSQISTVSCTGSNCKIYTVPSTVTSKRSAFTYDSAGNGATVFTRKITFENGSDPNREIKITSTVTWRTGSLLADQKVEVHTYLFNTDYDPAT